MKHKTVKIIILLLITLPMVMYVVNPYYLKMPWDMYQASSFKTVKSVAVFMMYLTKYGMKYEYNPETGVADLQSAAQTYQNQTDPNLLEQGKLEWHRGNFSSAISLIEKHQKQNAETESSVFWLAMSYMRQAEARNCLDRLLENNETAHHLKMCTLPLTAFHQQKQYSQEAARLFQVLLDRYDNKNRRYQWLLNFSYMTLDGFPEQVPERYRIKGNFVDVFYGDYKNKMMNQYGQLTFKDRAKQFNIDGNDSGRGVIVEDFDKDGYLDLIVAQGYGHLKYYKNDRGRDFIDVSKKAGLTGIKGTHVISGADYNNDGWMDIFVSRPFGVENGDFLLLKNNGDETFTDVTVSSGLLPEPEKRKEHILSFTSAWGDIDNDGDLDLFVSGWGFYNHVARSNPMAFNKSSVLYLNNKGTFIDVTDEYGLDSYVDGLNVFGAAFGDYDNDGFIDLFLTSWQPGGYLARNIKGKKFEQADIIPTQAMGFMAAFVDVNHDGLLDLFIGDAGLSDLITDQMIFGIGTDEYNQGNSTILLQTKTGNFVNHEDYFSSGMHAGTMGSNFGDINNDGAYDFYLGTGGPEGWHVIPNLMYIGKVDDQGRATGYMDNISMLNGFGSVQKGHGIVFFDFDNDGDQDIYSALGGMWPGDAWPNQLFVNESESNNTWVKIRLRGRRSNYYGLGARITAGIIWITKLDSAAHHIWHILDCLMRLR